MIITVEDLAETLAELDIWQPRESYQETAGRIMTALTGAPADQVQLTVGERS